MIFDATRRMVANRQRALSQAPAAGEVLSPHGVRIGRDERGGATFWPVPELVRASSAFVMGGSGTGKSLMLSSASAREYVASDSRSEMAEAMIVGDIKDDLVNGILGCLAHEAPERLRDVVVLSPFSPRAFPLNLCKLKNDPTPLDVRAAAMTQLVASVSASTASGGGGMGMRQMEVTQHVLLGALSVPHPDAHILLAQDALATEEGFKQLASLCTNRRAQQFLQNTRPSQELRVSCRSHLGSAFASTESLERLFCAPDCIDIDDLISPGRMTLVPAGMPPDGKPSTSAFYLNLLFRLILDWLMRRPSGAVQHHVRVIFDECQAVVPVLSDAAETLLTMARSRSASLVLATQQTTLIQSAAPNLLPVILANAPLKIVGRLGPADAELLARSQSVSLGSEESLAAVRSRFASQVMNLPDRTFFKTTPGSHVRFVSRTEDLASRERALDEHADAIRAATERYALPRTTAPRVTLEDLAGGTKRSTASAEPKPVAKTARSKWG